MEATEPGPSSHPDASTQAVPIGLCSLGNDVIPHIFHLAVTSSDMMAFRLVCKVVADVTLAPWRDFRQVAFVLDVLLVQRVVCMHAEVRLEQAYELWYPEFANGNFDSDEEYDEPVSDDDGPLDGPEASSTVRAYRAMARVVQASNDLGFDEVPDTLDEADRVAFVRFRWDGFAYSDPETGCRPEDMHVRRGARADVGSSLAAYDHLLEQHPLDRCVSPRRYRTETNERRNASLNLDLAPEVWPYKPVRNRYFDHV